MKIGVFDSGVGGLIILRAIRKRLSPYDYLYLGDTLHVPYGNRTQKQIYQFTKRGVEYLFKNNCALIIIACNSASSRALRRLQREWLPKHYPDRRILGVIIPTAEAAIAQKNSKKIGVLATKATTASKSFAKEIKKLSKNIPVVHQSAPLLVPLIEDAKIKECKAVLQKYLLPLLQKKVKTIILGCTHYPLIKKLLPKNIRVISQDEVVPEKLFVL
jgi:glutamate racemase